MLSPLLPLWLVCGYLVLAAMALMVRNAFVGPFRDAEIASRGDSALLPMGLRMFFAWAFKPLWLLVRWSGIPATGITTLSTLLAFGAGVAIAAGNLALGGWLYLAAGIGDVLDGRMARHLGSAGPKGAAIDSVLDRYSDAAVFVGLAWFYRDGWGALLAIVALVGSLLVSYVRARGEGLGVDVKVGLMQRPERVLSLGVALTGGPVVEVVSAGRLNASTVVLVVVGFIAAMTQTTALHRLAHLTGKLDANRSMTPRRYRQLAPAIVSALVATGADFGLVSLLVMTGVLGPAAATAAGCLLGGLINFSMNRWWTFSSTARPAPQAMRYVIVSVASALLNSGGVALIALLPLAGDYRIGWIIVRGLVFLCWNFPLQRDYVYGPGGEGRPVADSNPEITPASRRLKTAP